jgi:predicted DNA-binding transcriptional regulator AlpA
MEDRFMAESKSSVTDSPSQDEVLRAQDVAQALDVSIGQAYNAMNNYLPSFRIGGSIRIRRSALDGYISSQEARHQP